MNVITKSTPVPGAPAGRRPELLAPAGDWDCARAAVENGADAIYFGLEKFNARMRASNFTAADLPRLMQFLHRRGVKGYVTFNTLAFQSELPEAEQFLRAIISAGADAAIVQDVGLCRLIRGISPDFPIHASTQMTITSAAGVRFAKELGCHLVVLARECSIREIGLLTGSAEPAAGRGAGQSAATAAPVIPTQADPDHGLPLEVFVHGALCVAYSGQCLTSEALGGRSANRGECAQACRMPYELICDGQPVPLGDRKYLLSPQDLSGAEILPELVRSGVASLKIEGRLKTPEYVANITRVYRQALDAAAAPAAAGASAGGAASAAANDRYDLEMAFSRGLHTGWFRGINNQELVHARFGKKRGVFLGEVTRVTHDQVFLKALAPMKAGDGVVFDAGHPEQKEEGGRIYEVRLPKPGSRGGSAAEVALLFGRDDLDLARIHPGDRVWKTSDPELDRRIRQTYEGESPRFRRPIQMEVHGRAGQPLVLIARDEMGHTVQGASSIPLAPAEKRPLTAERLREQLGRLGGTAFRLDQLLVLLEGDVILPVSELNQLRRDAVLALDELRSRPQRWTMHSPPACPAFSPALDPAAATPDSPAQPAGNSELVVLVRSLPQLAAVLGTDVTTVYCDFDDPRKYREAVRLVRDSNGAGQPERTIWVAPPRIFKAGEEWTLRQVRSCEADGYLVRNYDHLSFFADCRRIGDFSLNVANALAAGYFKERFHLEFLTPSYDLNGGQLEALLEAAPPEWFEITIHQHMPMFHMEHCVFCAFLSSGTDFTNCGRPCDRHEVRLRDRVGAEHLLKADVGCRNTLFNALAQTGAEHVTRLQALGARRFRIEFVAEPPDQVTQTIARYRQLLRGEIDGSRLWRELKLLNQLGVTRGSLERR